MVDDERWALFEAKRLRMEALTAFLLSHRRPDDGGDGASVAQFLKRPEVTLDQYRAWLGAELPELMAEQAAADPAGWELKSVETALKFEGYLVQQRRQMDQLRAAEAKSIPDGFDYQALSGLSTEMREKLTRVRPVTLGQAARIPGVTPAAMSLLLVHLEIRKRETAAQMR
jgi:tRNA uridine 5-carboxymethylaminomethyl modification enzyme